MKASTSESDQSLGEVLSLLCYWLSYHHHEVQTLHSTLSLVLQVNASGLVFSSLETRV